MTFNGLKHSRQWESRSGTSGARAAAGINLPLHRFADAARQELLAGLCGAAVPEGSPLTLQRDREQGLHQHGVHELSYTRRGGNEAAPRCLTSGNKP